MSIENRRTRNERIIFTQMFCAGKEARILINMATALTARPTGAVKRTNQKRVIAPSLASLLSWMHFSECY